MYSPVYQHLNKGWCRVQSVFNFFRNFSKIDIFLYGYFVFSIFFHIFAAGIIVNKEIMTALQMNAELYRAMGVIADDETLMAKVLKYVKRLAAKKEDPTLMTKEEFFARVDEAKKGPTYRMQPNENLSTFLKRIGNDL